MRDHESALQKAMLARLKADPALDQTTREDVRQAIKQDAV